jgi:general secretion pathway protein M
MRGTWQALEPRERRTLLLGALVLVLVLGYLAVWAPLAKARADLRARVAQGAVELEWMRRAAPLLADSSAPLADPLQHDGRSLLARVDAGAREAGLGQSLLRVEPVGDGEVRMAFQSADFDALVGWLEQFGAGNSATVTELSVQRVEGVGLVDARVALRETAR